MDSGDRHSKCLMVGVDVTHEGAAGYDPLPNRYSNPTRCRTYRHGEMELAALLSGPRKLTAVAPPLNDGRTMAAEPDGAC